MCGSPPVGLNRGRVHREENVGLDYRWHREIPAPPETRFPAQKVGTIGREESTIFPFISSVADLHLVSLRIRLRIQGFEELKLEINYSWKFLPWAFKREHPALFVGYFCPPESGLAFPMRTRIRIQPTEINADPDPQHCSQVSKIHTLRLQLNAAKNTTDLNKESP